MRPRAFTLIELLVVAAMIAFLAVGLGAALRRNSGTELRTAQYLIAGLASQARYTAITQETETRLVVYATAGPAGDAVRFLRLLEVFRAQPPGSNAWISVGPAAQLPRGVSVVPPAGGATGKGVAASNLPVGNGSGLRSEHFDAADTVLYAEFRSDGRPGDPTRALEFVVEAAGAFRGVRIRANGSSDLLNEPGDF
jgi:prepilin-type N-terminal cleavage/methylation domain-containing protein